MTNVSDDSIPPSETSAIALLFEVLLAELKIRKTNTKKGLNVFPTILTGLYKTGPKVAQEFKETMKIIFDDDLLQ